MPIKKRGRDKIEKERESMSTAVTLLLATDHPALTLPHLTHWDTALLDSRCVCVCICVCVYVHQLHLTFIPTRICKTDHTNNILQSIQQVSSFSCTHTHALGPLTGTLHERITIIHQWKPVKYEIWRLRPSLPKIHKHVSDYPLWLATQTRHAMHMTSPPHQELSGGMRL